MKTYSNTDIKQVRFKKCDMKSMKDMAHTYFDQLWIYNYFKREEAYKWLSEYLGVEESKAHMTVMDYKTCKKVVEGSIMILNDFRRLDLDFGCESKHPYYELIN